MFTRLATKFFIIAKILTVNCRLLVLSIIFFYRSSGQYVGTEKLLVVLVKFKMNIPWKAYFPEEHDDLDNLLWFNT